MRLIRLLPKYNSQDIDNCLNALEQEGIIRRYEKDLEKGRHYRQLLFLDELTNSREETLELKEELLELIHERKIIRIMGRNFFGTLEWAVFYKVFLHDVPEIPWTVDFLESPCPFNKGKKVRDTHFLFLAPVFFRVDKKLTINTWLEICGTGKKMPHPKFSSFRSGPWWCEKGFADKQSRIDFVFSVFTSNFIPLKLILRHIPFE